MIESNKRDVVRTLESLKDTAINGKSLSSFIDAVLDRVNKEFPDPVQEKQTPVDQDQDVERNMNDVRRDIATLRVSSVGGRNLSAVADAMNKALDDMEPKPVKKQEQPKKYEQAHSKPA